MKKIMVLLALSMLFVWSACAADVPEEPTFSVTSGIYPNTVYLTLSGAGDIYYTTDGSIPTTASNRYQSPIAISPTTTELQIISGWRRENVETKKIPSGTVIRAAVINSGQSSRVVTHTYFIGSDIMDYYGNIPIVNLTVTPYDLWDPKEGIYSNYDYEHKVPSSFQYFNTQGICDINRTTEVKVSGHGSRSNPKKSLRVYFKNTDPTQSKYLEYPLIKDNYDANNDLITKYSKVTFRISDYSNTDLRDVVAQKLAESTSADTAASNPMALFLNGEFWGMYECREQYDEDYVAAHYDVDDNDVVFLDRDWTLEPQYEVLSDTGSEFIDKIEYSGPKDGNNSGRLGESYYLDQWRYVQSLCIEQDITDPAVYAQFCAAVDVDSFIDFLIVYIYAANDDWPGNNFKFWRVTEENIDPSKYGADGKWRFMIHDFDIAFENIWHETLELSALGDGDVDDARHPLFATKMLKGILRNADFRNEFAQRTMAYLNTTMSADGMKNIVSKLQAQRQDGKNLDLLRWGWGPADFRLNMWLENMSRYVRFASDRCSVLKSHYTEILNENYNANITGEAHVRLITPFSNGSTETTYYINGADMSVGGGKIYSVFSGIPVTVSAKSDDGSPVQLQVIYSGGVVTGTDEISFTPKKDEICTISAVGLERPADNALITSASIARSARFSIMSADEVLPAILISSDGDRLPAKFSITGDCAIIDDFGRVKAVKPGTGILTAEYEGQSCTANIVVK